MTGNPVTPPSGELSESRHLPVQPRKTSSHQGVHKLGNLAAPLLVRQGRSPTEPLSSCRWERVARTAATP